MVSSKALKMLAMLSALSEDATYEAKTIILATGAKTVLLA